jgi:hypothetical protein
MCATSFCEELLSTVIYGYSSWADSPVLCVDLDFGVVDLLW